MAVGAKVSRNPPVPVRKRNTTSLAWFDTYRYPCESMTESIELPDDEPAMSALKSEDKTTVTGATDVQVAGHEVKLEAWWRTCVMKSPKYIFFELSMAMV